MEDLMQEMDPAIYGRFGGPREYGTAEGRFGGGGWLSDPLAATDPDGMGVVMPAAGRDGERNLTSPGFSGNGAYGANPLLDAVERSAGPFSTEGGWF